MKKILTFIFALAAVLALCSVSVFATDTEAVAMVGDTEYASLQEAIDAAQLGETVVVLKDTELSEGLVVSKNTNVVLDLNGKTISQVVECTKSYEMIANNGTLSIIDSIGGGKISFTDISSGDETASWGSYTIRNNGTLVVDDVTIENLSAQNVAGAAFKHTSLAIFQYSGSCTINGGVISCPNYRSVRLWLGEMVINGGTFVGQVWVQCVDDTADMTINGGSFAPCWNDGSSVFINNVEHEVSFSITNGTFATKVGANNTSTIAGSIIGGTFSAKAIASMGENSALFGGKLTQNDDGSYSVFISLESVFTFLGYSKSNDNDSITAGYTVDQELLAMYIQQNGLDKFDFGCAFGIDSINEKTATSFKSFTEYQNFNVKIVGIDVSNETHINAALMMALYVDLGNGEEKSYVIGTGEDNGVAIVAANAVPSITFKSLLQ